MNIGDKINFLTLKEQTHKVNGNWCGLFVCDCGVEKNIRINAVTTQSTKSCGCHRRKTCAINGKSVVKHNLSNHPLYKIWIDLKKNHKQEICIEWMEFVNFYNWAKDIWRKGLSIHRYNIDKEYCNENCLFERKEKVCLQLRKNTCLHKYGVEFPQTLDSTKEKIKQTNIDKYGYTSSSKSELVKNQTILNNQKKYGVDFPQQLLENRNKNRQRTIDNKQAYVLDGKTTPQWAKELNISNSALINRIHKYGFDKAVSIETNISNIEFVIKQLLLKHNVNFKQEFMVENRFADFYLPDNNLIIEADGLYWHSDAINKDKYYHRNKQRLYEHFGYVSLFFREDEIENKFDVVESVILNKLKLSQRIFARKCIIEKVNKKVAKDFLNQNHLMGNGRGDSYCLTLNGDILSIIQVLMRKDIMEISRFCNKLNYSVVGGFSRLLNFSIKEKCPSVVGTFIDKRYGKGLYLYDLGFEKVNEDISFVWVKDDKTFHRLKYRGNSGYDYGLYKLWDCGQIRFTKTL